MFILNTSLDHYKQKMQIKNHKPNVNTSHIGTSEVTVSHFDVVLMSYITFEYPT